MDKCINGLREAKKFSTLDSNSGYWPIEIDARNRGKTTFTSNHGLYRFVRIPFALKNDPATFQRATGVILASLRWQLALVYVEDIVLFSKSPAGHMEQILCVLRVLHEVGSYSN